MNGATSFDVTTLMNDYAVAILIGLALALVVEACYSYKLLRINLVLIFGVTFATVGAVLGGMFIPAVSGVNVGVAIGAVCGIIGALIGKNCFKFCMFICGAGLGYVVGAIVVALFAPQVAFLQDPIVALVVLAVCALIIGILSIFILKTVYILVMSVGGMTVAGALAGLAVTEGVVVSITGSSFSYTLPENLVFVLAGAAVGLIAGIIAAVYQFRNSYEF